MLPWCGRASKARGSSSPPPRRRPRRRRLPACQRPRLGCGCLCERTLSPSHALQMPSPASWRSSRRRWACLGAFAPQAAFPPALPPAAMCRSHMGSLCPCTTGAFSLATRSRRATSWRSTAMASTKPTSSRPAGAWGLGNVCLGSPARQSAACCSSRLLPILPHLFLAVLHGNRLPSCPCSHIKKVPKAVVHQIASKRETIGLRHGPHSACLHLPMQAMLLQLLTAAGMATCCFLIAMAAASSCMEAPSAACVLIPSSPACPPPPGPAACSGRLHPRRRLRSSQQQQQQPGRAMDAGAQPRQRC